MKKILVLFLFLVTSANAADSPALKQKTVGLPDPALIAKVENYLNSIKTMQADFGQVVQGSSVVSAGKFYLQRPGKFRWEYIKGQQVLIVSNGMQIAYYDRKLDELTYIPMQYGIAGFLAAEKIKLSGDIKLLRIEENETEIRAVVTQTKKPEEGMLALYFKKDPMILSYMEVVDQDKNLTVVAFKNQKINQPIAKDLFVFKNPKFLKNVWDKK